MTHPLVGQRAPEFTLTDQLGSTITPDFLAGTAVLLVFFPFAFSEVCTSELDALRDARDLRDRQDLHVIMCSVDSVYTLRAWAEVHEYDGPLLSDFWPHGAAAQAYGVFDQDKGLATRGSFLIDAAGVVRWSVVNPDNRERSLEQYRAAVTELLGPDPAVATHSDGA